MIYDYFYYSHYTYICFLSLLTIVKKGQPSYQSAANPLRYIHDMRLAILFISFLLLRARLPICPKKDRIAGFPAVLFPFFGCTWTDDNRCIELYFRLSIYLFTLSIYLSFYLSIYLSIFLSIYLFIYLSIYLYDMIWYDIVI